MTIRDISYTGEGLIPAPLDGGALRYEPLPKDAVTDIAIHHWTGWLPPETWTAAEEIAYIICIDEYHRTGRGLDGIGYQLAPFPSGRIYIVSRLDRYGAGVGGENNHIINIGLPGSFRSTLPSPRHLAATVEAVQYVYGYLGRDVPTTPHLAWGGTTCPGELWRSWCPQLREQALQEGDDMTDEQLKAILGAIAAHDGQMQARRDQIIGDIIKAITAHDRSMQGRRDQIMKAIAAIGTGGGASPAQVLEQSRKALKLGGG